MDATLFAQSIDTYKIFKDFDLEVIQQIYKASPILSLSPGEILITKGEQNDNLFLLLEGMLEVVLEKDGTQIAIPIDVGECLGEMSLVMGIPTSALAQAKATSKVLCIPKEVFWQKMTTSRQGIRNLMDMMAQRLRRTNFALIREVEEQLKYKHLEKELETAGKIQANMVPDGANLFPNRPEVEAFGLINQARMVGGDFYDALALDHEHIYFSIGDVSGKGMPAALLMARIITSLRLTVSDRTDFRDVFSTVNHRLSKKNDDLMFVSAFGGVLNVKTGKLRFSNGGHNPPFVALQGSEFQLLKLPSGGTLLGVFEDSSYDLGELQLEPGDSLILYTDGVTEATRGDQEMLGEDRTQSYLRACSHDRMEDLVFGLESYVSRFVDGAPQNDDLTIFGIRYLG